MGCVKSKEDIKSKEIDNKIKIDRYFVQQRQRIALLGAGESGKSTFLKQMHIIHGTGFSNEQKLDYRGIIYDNIVNGINYLINAKNELNISWSSPESESYAKEFRIKSKNLISQNPNNIRKGTPIQPKEFLEVIPYIRNLWFKDHVLKTLYERRREFPQYFVDNVEYYMENLDRLIDEKYLPSNDDILRVRVKTTGIKEDTMIIKNIPFMFFDVGGQRVERGLWKYCFIDITAVIFFVSCSEYDEYLREDSSKNRLEESLQTFQAVANHILLKNRIFILFLNKEDLLIEKIQHSDISKYCNDFQGNPKNIENVKKYLVKKFVSSRAPSFNVENQNKQSNIYTHFTTAVNTNNIKTIFSIVHDTIIDMHMCDFKRE